MIDVYELPSQRAVTPAVIAALIVIAIAGGLGGWYVTTSLLNQNGAARGAGTTPTGVAPRTGGPPAGGTTSGGGRTPGGSTAGATSAGGGTPGTSANACPDVTEQAARAGGSPGGLALVLYIRTDTGTSGSEVWICRDTAGNLFYQGHRLPSPFTVATSNSSLFLGTVVPVGDQFVATNVTVRGTTRYLVSRTELVIENNGTPAPPEPVVTAAGPTP